MVYIVCCCRALFIGGYGYELYRVSVIAASLLACTFCIDPKFGSECKYVGLCTLNTSLSFTV